MDYLGIPFQCSLCRSTGHLQRDCKGLVEEEESEDSMLWRAPREPLLEIDSFESITLHFSQEDYSQVEQMDTLSGKIKKIVHLYIPRYHRGNVTHWILQASWGVFLQIPLPVPPFRTW
jgi:hypothetical protein